MIRADQIGDPQREIVVEPVHLPDPTEVPQEQPVRPAKPEPVKEPVRV